MRGCSVQNSPRSCRLAHLEILLSGPPSTVSSWRLTAAARRKNSSPENLTHLHYNLLGKDSRRERRVPRYFETNIAQATLGNEAGLYGAAYLPWIEKDR